MMMPSLLETSTGQSGKLNAGFHSCISHRGWCFFARAGLLWACKVQGPRNSKTWPQALEELHDIVERWHKSLVVLICPAAVCCMLMAVCSILASIISKWQLQHSAVCRARILYDTRCGQHAKVRP